MTALARLLVDFGAPQPPGARRDPAAREAAPARRRAHPDESAAFADLAPGAPANAAPPAPAPSPQAALDAARAEGADEARAQAQAQAAAQLAELEAAHEARLAQALAEARAQWLAAESEALAARIDRAFAELRTEVEEGVAAVLRPLARACAAREAARLMAADIARLLAGAGPAGSDPGAAPLEIAGPADLIDAVRDALDADPRVGPTPAREGRLRFVEAEGVDAYARLGRAEVETRLAAFASALERPE